MLDSDEGCQGPYNSSSINAWHVTANTCTLFVLSLFSHALGSHWVLDVDEIAKGESGGSEHWGRRSGQGRGRKSGIGWARQGPRREGVLEKGVDCR